MGNELTVAAAIVGIAYAAYAAWVVAPALVATVKAWLRGDR